MITETLILSLALGSTMAAPAQEPSEGEKLFALHVQNILQEKCVACHSRDDDKKLKGELVLTSRQEMLAGGESSDQVLVPGDAKNSLLYIAASWADPDYEMPPKEADRLTEQQTWHLRDWINAGAPWPDEQRVAAIQDKYAEGVQLTTSGGLDDSWTNRRYKPEDLWAYKPITRPEIPGSHTGNPVDHFIDKKLASLNLEPAPPASSHHLLRRLTYTLTGLPPAAGKAGTFDIEHQESKIESLLSSPHYGEHMARHWLDVVRYADSSGFANDYERPNTWRYRDYVVRSFNADKPYDQFVREQIAGDEIDRNNPENLIATGFLRMGPWEHTGMSVAKVTRQLFLDDVTDSVGQVFLAHALQCARCHDHKFDPVPTRDYYAIQSVFSTTQFAETDTGWLPGENRQAIDGYRRYHQKRKAANDTARNAIPKDSQKSALKSLTNKWHNRFTWESDRFKPLAFTVYNGKTRTPNANNGRITMPANPMQGGILEQATILTGGDPFSPSEPVSPGVLSAADPHRTTLPDSVSGRRTGLAEWIAADTNPLTARVMVNRIWAYHFGRGLAANPNNFGTTGAKPTHPQLLDYLATEFIASGWSVKHIHRLILGSKAYARSTNHPDPDKLAKLDPNATSYAAFSPRRLTAEEIRDAMLTVSGELNPEIGGLPARPDMNLEAALQPRMIMGTFAPSYIPNPKPGQRNRRTLYAHKTRGQRDPFLEVFNQPGPDASCELRDASNVTPQVFTLLNSEESA
ncbi:MAG: PSD1 and planctomycete cytochrome C domain-containing protein, partial [Verrucomicrobiales bacterium]|nr:PSD1 and planctomycete cytochrome C domain-containing protein [Verrucomicrobiales bacterium]